MVGKTDSVITIKHEHLPPVVLLTQSRFEGLQETVEIMSDPELMADIREAMEDKTPGIPFEDVLKKLERKPSKRKSQL